MWCVMQCNTRNYTSYLKTLKILLKQNKVTFFCLLI